MDICFRDIELQDGEFLREMLYRALFVPPGVAPYDRSVLELPEISRYLFNMEAGVDFGIILLVSGLPAGAVWAKLFSDAEKGYGFVDEETPELTIAVKEEFRNRGYGRLLMKQIFQLAIEKGYRQVSLSVDKRSSAYRFYRSLGFVAQGGTEQSPTMVKDFSGAHCVRRD